MKKKKLKLDINPQFKAALELMENSSSMKTGPDIMSRTELSSALILVLIMANSP